MANALTSNAVYLESQVDSDSPRTLFYYDKLVEKHEKPDWMIPPEVHQENSCRTRLAVSRLHGDPLLGRLEIKNGRDATNSELELVHSSAYLSIMKKTENMRQEELKHFRSQYDDIYISRDTWAAALRAAGSAIDLVDQICGNERTNGMANIRPPGHHAGPDYAQGFCFLNNAALCANYAIERHNLERIMIVDWDVHFGNGTQHIFYEDPRVLFVSIHTFQEGRVWPWLKEADVNYIGAGKGIGKNINVPLNKTQCNYGDYNAIFREIILPLAEEFAPQLMIVSCGFDAGQDDPEGEMELTPAAFANLTAQLKAVKSISGRLALVLEGGYNVPLVAESTMACLRVLAGDAPPVLDAGAPAHEIVHMSIERLKSVLQPYWKCFGVSTKTHADGDTYNEKPANFDYHDYDRKAVSCPESERLETKWTSEHQAAIKKIDAELRQKNY